MSATLSDHDNREHLNNSKAQLTPAHLEMLEYIDRVYPAPKKRSKIASFFAWMLGE
ncbi:hypothetical protein [Corynebacterium aquilae]|uniref:hypothetical protein n=1 Tax=Corynebacterium aquilae TaxID=203263 RepID=UPI0012EE652C|nr:hypothetical protein [Corynebacterium aquilae]